MQSTTITAAAQSILDASNASGIPVIDIVLALAQQPKAEARPTIAAKPAPAAPKGPRKPARNGSDHRTTRVMRRLRRVAIREYEVLYRVLVLGERLEDTEKDYGRTEWCWALSARSSHPAPGT